METSNLSLMGLAGTRKCPAAPTAPLPGNLAAKIEIYHYYEQNRTSLKSIYSMQEVLFMTCTGNFYFSILLPGREIYFLGQGLA